MVTENTSFMRRNWRMLLTAVTFLALISLVYAIWDQIVETFQSLDSINLWYIALMIPLQALFYHCTVLKYISLFRLLHSKLSYGATMRAALELNFVNHVFPSGGVSGFSYFGLSMRRNGIRAAKATLVQTMRFVLLFISFQPLIFMALVLLALDGQVNNFLLLVSASLSTLLIVGSLALTYIIGSKKRINDFFTTITVIINKIIQLIMPKHPETININRAKQLFADYHENYMTLKKDYSQLYRPLVYALLINLAEILTVYVVFLAFGQPVNLGAVIIAYAVANFAGLISVLPGGIGIYEGLMVAILVAGGVPAALSLPVIVMYRILNIVLQIPVGGYLYYKRIHEQ